MCLLETIVSKKAYTIYSFWRCDQCGKMEMVDGIMNPDSWVWIEDDDENAVLDFCNYECYCKFTNNVEN